MSWKSASWFAVSSHFLIYSSRPSSPATWQQNSTVELKSNNKNQRNVSTLIIDMGFLKSIHRNLNYEWDNKAYPSAANTHFEIIASNVLPLNVIDLLKCIISYFSSFCCYVSTPYPEIWQHLSVFAEYSHIDGFLRSLRRIVNDEFIIEENSVPTCNLRLVAEQRI